MIEIKKDPSQRELRWFGLMAVLFLGLVGSLLVFKFDAWKVAYILWSLGVALGLIYYLFPALQRWVYLGWMYLFFPIGWAVSNILLALVFYVVLTPIGIIMRILGKDPMQRRLDRQADTYWIAHEPGKDRARYFRQF